jgi:general secretion pathway protein J
MKGFTLLEMLVALFIFGLVSAAGVGVLRFSMDNQELVRVRIERLAELESARALLKADLLQAVARRVRDAHGRPNDFVFAGNQQSGGGPLLALTRRGLDNPDGDPRPSLQYIEYRLADGVLERVARPALDGGEVLPARRLLAGVRTASLQFLWRGQWLEALPRGAHVELPQAVRLDLELQDYGAVSQLLLVTGAPR